MLRIQRPLPERYVTATTDDLNDRIAAAKATLGSRLFILGHHYQRDEIIRWADARGDSYRLSVLAQQRPEAEFIVFCGVHFMAESADILTEDHQAVILPDLNAGCSMADMADIDDVEEAWEALAGVIDVERLVPVTYMNSSADLKAFVGRHGGAVCTSTNARAVLEWALRGGKESVGATGGGDKVLFFPDQHLGRNTGVAMGYGLAVMRLWNPRFDLGGLSEADCKEATLLLWRGWCTIHQRFQPAHIDAFRAEHPDGIVVVHPECPHETVLQADQVGSTDFIIKAIEAAPVGATIAVGTEVHLINRLAQENPDKTVVSLDPLICPCSTMNRIDLPHLCWVLEELVAGRVTNQITVDPDTAEWAKVALQRMLEIV
ncbi:MAG: quinolinate synthase NadA [Actinomycetota bacterium]|nr:quinolinate synthase NadA [Acidimicrobiia bacterium]MDQ3293627.1 quinolinate synthase NadA [Actinomycetota bacterium]